MFKTHYAYMFRVDLSNNETSYNLILNWLDKHMFHSYHGCHEIGTETGKHHYQMIIWRENKYLQKDVVKARNWWRNKTNSKTHGVALTSARKIASLISYSGKDIIKLGKKEQKTGIISNLGMEKIKLIPKWQSKTALKQQKREKLQKIIGGISQNLDRDEYLVELEQAYYHVYSKPCFRKNYYLENLRIAGYMNSHDVLNEVFPNGPPSCNYSYKIKENKKIKLKKNLKKKSYIDM